MIQGPDRSEAWRRKKAFAQGGTLPGGGAALYSAVLIVFFRSLEGHQLHSYVGAWGGNANVCPGTTYSTHQSSLISLARQKPVHF